ncbi:MAG: hypothetical protein R2715_00550 [Ilumatobacteraceae bacterium]
MVREPVRLGAEVLHERAAERHVQHLDPSADGEHRQAEVQRCVDERELQVVVVLHDPVELLGRRLLPVPAWVDVTAAVQ